ncbi:transposase [Streptomyces griseorubiginosus]|uniref:transposase n=1 Tax=Streptomyces griseorubiginosus TaxID=67304 RepID=UPI0034568BC5
MVEPLLPPARVGPRGGRRAAGGGRRAAGATSAASDRGRDLLRGFRTGRAWRQLPKDFPPWPTVYSYLTWWHDDGTLERVHEHCGIGCARLTAAMPNRAPA